MMFITKTIASQLFFEFRSWIGRMFLGSRSRIPINNNPLLLNVGAGRTYINDWVNIDFYRFSYLSRNKAAKKYKRADVEMDLRYPFKCSENTVDGVYSCHTLEHLDYDKAKNMLSEIYRILKPRAWLRIIVPDLEIHVQFYIGEFKELPYNTGCEAISSLTQQWGHLSVWDNQYLTKILSEIGFINIKKLAYGQEGTDKRLIIETESRKNESLVIEAQKA